MERLHKRTRQSPYYHLILTYLELTHFGFEPIKINIDFVLYLAAKMM
jgi:hypothetical protein